MPDREKVIKGLECCRRGFCFACPYNDGVDENTDCKQKWADDALALLKEFEPAKPFFSSDRRWLCGNCMREVEKYGGDNYCPGCGRKLLWE